MTVNDSAHTYISQLFACSLYCSDLASFFSEKMIPNMQISTVKKNIIPSSSNECHKPGYCQTTRQAQLVPTVMNFTAYFYWLYHYTFILNKNKVSWKSMIILKNGTKIWAYLLQSGPCISPRSRSKTTWPFGRFEPAIKWKAVSIHFIILCT